MASTLHLGVPPARSVGVRLSAAISPAFQFQTVSALRSLMRTSFPTEGLRVGCTGSGDPDKTIRLHEEIPDGPFMVKIDQVQLMFKPA